MTANLERLNQIILTNQQENLKLGLQRVVDEDPTLSAVLVPYLSQLEAKSQCIFNGLRSEPCKSEKPLLLRRCFASADTTALLIVDVQYGFVCGSLRTDQCPARMNALDIMEPINILCELAFKQIYFSQDWHPPDHVSFHENRTKWKLSKNSKIQDATQAKIGDQIRIIESVGVEREQKLWPTHCVGESQGAAIYPSLRLPDYAIPIQKGTINDVESYSVFGDPTGREDTGFDKKLHEAGIEVLVVCGIAFDVCVVESALEAAKRGYRVIVVEDACVGIDPDGMVKARRHMLEAGIHITHYTKIPAILSGVSTPLQHVLKMLQVQSSAQ